MTIVSVGSIRKSYLNMLWTLFSMKYFEGDRFCNSILIRVLIQMNRIKNPYYRIPETFRTKTVKIHFFFAVSIFAFQYSWSEIRKVRTYLLENSNYLTISCWTPMGQNNSVFCPINSDHNHYHRNDRNIFQPHLSQVSTLSSNYLIFRCYLIQQRRRWCLLNLKRFLDWLISRV